jgi:Flp pilus assembly protein TadG
MIRTGQMQSNSATAATFTTQICSELSWLGSNCTSNLSVNVQTFSSFSNITAINPISNGKLNTGALQFNMGAAGDIVLVQAFYQWTLIAPMIDGAAQPLSGGKTLISAAAAFRNEPY